jgi:hypothetical protein
MNGPWLQEKGAQVSDAGTLGPDSDRMPSANALVQQLAPEACLLKLFGFTRLELAGLLRPHSLGPVGYFTHSVTHLASKRVPPRGHTSWGAQGVRALGRSEEANPPILERQHA